MKLKEYFANTGVQQKFLANKAGVSPSALNSYALGKKTPNIETAWKIEQATDGYVTVYDWLFKEPNICSDATIDQKDHKKCKKSPSKKRV